MFKLCYSRPVIYRKGFTLIEAVMVIVIIGILTVVSLPNIGVFHVLKLSGAGKKLLSDIRYAHNIALTQSVYTGMQFSSANNTYAGSFCHAANTNDCFPVSTTHWSFLKDPLSRMDLWLDYNSDSQYRGVSISAASFGAGDMLVFSPRGVPMDCSNTPLAGNGTVAIGYKEESVNFYITAKTGKVYFDQSF